MLYQKPYKPRRITLINVLIILCFVALTARMGYIAYFDGPEFAAAAVNQRRLDMDGRRVRGSIYDRNMLPLTNAQIGLSVAVTADMLTQNPFFQSELTRILDVNRANLSEMIPERGVHLLELTTIDQQFIDAAALVGTRIITDIRRYSDNGVAAHLIGYSPQNNDAAGFGLERAFNDILSGDFARIGIIREPGAGFPLTNVGQSYNIDSGGIRLTLDFHIQQAVEAVMEEMVPRGAVVVACVQTGDILAMASRGNFSQNNLREYLQSEDGELLNRAITAFDAGSIFKIVTAAAAIEEGLIDDDFSYFCGGYMMIDGRQFACNNRYGHGQITFEQAFAYSCNIPFYRLGIQIGYDLLNEYSVRFGLDSTVLNLDNFGESAGLLPAREYISNSKLANMSIGQGDTMLTPLQVANMVNIVANRGVAIPLNLADSHVDRFGNVQQNFRQDWSERVIHESTAVRLMELMEIAVTHGTGRRAVNASFTAGGKTSSAETGWTENGEFMVHAWFGGFVPADEPRFSITVFVQNGRQGATAAAPVFREIADRIFTIGR